MKPLWSITLFYIVLLIACQDDIPAPEFLEIEDYKISPHNQIGFNDHNFTEIYVYVNDIFAGAPGLPILLPFSSQIQSPKITLFPGIRENGIALNPVIYPFIEKYQASIDINSGTIIQITPEFTYKTKTIVRMVDPFEGETAFSNILMGDSSFQWNYDQSDKIEGESAGVILLSSGIPAIELATSRKFKNLPIDGSPVYLELSYKNEIPFSIGLMGSELGGSPSKNYKIALRPRDDWNKIYINFTPDIQLSQLSEYDIIIKAELETPDQESRIYLDNIKFLHL